jgi:hypothetical protein
MSTILSQPACESETAPPQRRYPRYKIVGGFDISTPIATAWASRLVGEELHPYHDQPSVSMIIREKVRPHGADFVDVTETDEPAYMLITQSARFNGYKGMDPKLIPQFTEGRREAVARELLGEEGSSCSGLLTTTLNVDFMNQVFTSQSLKRHFVDRRGLS